MEKRKLILRPIQDQAGKMEFKKHASQPSALQFLRQMPKLYHKLVTLVNPLQLWFMEYVQHIESISSTGNIQQKELHSLYSTFFIHTSYLSKIFEAIQIKPKDISSFVKL